MDRSRDCHSRILDIHHAFAGRQDASFPAANARGSQFDDRHAVPLHSGPCDDGQHGPAAADAAEFIWLSSIRSEEHTSELQSLMRISYAVFCLIQTKTRCDL